MLRISLLGVALAALTLSGCKTAQRTDYYQARPVAVQGAPCPNGAPCANGQIPPPPAFAR